MELFVVFKPIGERNVCLQLQKEGNSPVIIKTIFTINSNEFTNLRNVKKADS